MEERLGGRSTERGETEFQPLILPFALRQLRDSSSVIVKREVRCCWSLYSVCCADEGTLFTLEGIWGYGLKDNNGKQLAQIQRRFRCFRPRSLRVVIRGSLPVTVGSQTSNSQAVLIQDCGRTVLRIRKPEVVMHSTQFEITSNTTNTAIGWVTKEGSEYEVRFPEDIHVRHKAALIAACVYIDTLPGKSSSQRASTTHGARRPASNTYINLEDSLYNYLVMPHTFAYNSA